MGDTYRSVRGGMVNWGGFAMSWQDKERERYEGKLRDNFTVDGKMKEAKTVSFMPTTGTLTTSADKSDDLFALTSKMKRARSITKGAKYQWQNLRSAGECKQ